MSFGFGFGVPSQASASGGATLNLNFVGSTTLDPKITFTRASTGSYYGSNGLLALSPVNMLTYSEQFNNAAWAKGGVTTVTANQIEAPDGTLTADKANAVGVSGNWADLAQNVTVGAGNNVGKTYTFSAWVRVASGTSTAVLRISDVNFNTYSSSSQIITTTWQRFTFTSSGGAGWNASGTAIGGGFVLAQGVDFYIWGAQLQTGSTATTYIPTTATASGAPRFDYDPVTLQPKGLLIEEQRTNLLTYSEQFDNAVWTKTGSTVTANAVVAPDGTTTADKVEETATTGQHLVTQASTVVAASSYNVSVYAKAAERSIIRVTDTASTAAINVDLSAGSILSSSLITNPQILSVGNGWYRISGSFTSSGTTAAITAYPIVGGTSSYLGVAGNGFYIWGAQLEAGAFATSYIPTVAAQVTRAADNAVMTGTNFSSWFNATEGTFAVNVSPIAIDNDIALSVSDGSGYANSVYITADNAQQFTVVVGSAVQAQIDAGTLTANTSNKISATYKLNDFAASVGGGGVVADTSGTIPTVDRAVIGGLQGNTANILNGTIRSITYWPRRLSNAELQGVTA